MAPTTTAQRPTVTIDIPAFPNGWTEANWKAYCNSPANRHANRIYKLATALLADIRPFLRDYGGDIDEVARRSVGVPEPTQNGDRLAMVHCHFAGLGWALHQAVDCCDILPDDPDAEPTTVPSEDTFDGYLAWLKSDNPEFAKRLAGMTGMTLRREMMRLECQWACLRSPIYKDAFVVRNLASELYEWMTAFCEQYDGTEGMKALEAAGIQVTDSEHHHTADKCAELHSEISGFRHVVGVLAGTLANEVFFDPFPPTVTTGRTTS